MFVIYLPSLSQAHSVVEEELLDIELTLEKICLFSIEQQQKKRPQLK